jgi:hypothetical protein
MELTKLVAVLKRLLNELPVIAVGVWAVLRVVGIDVDEQTTGNVVTTVESVGVLLLGMLLRRNTDGPVTVYETWHANKKP